MGEVNIQDIIEFCDREGYFYSIQLRNSYSYPVTQIAVYDQRDLCVAFSDGEDQQAVLNNIWRQLGSEEE
jgi:hypothetical protein